jgi:hypothetical protein
MTYEKLGEIAKQVIIKVMREGEKSYPDNDFLERSTWHHYEHAKAHFYNYQLSDYKDMEEIEHALTRIAIILVKGRNEHAKRNSS